MSLAAQVQAIVDGGEEADEILRASLAAVHEATGAPWSAIAFVEEREMSVGPLLGSVGPLLGSAGLLLPSAAGVQSVLVLQSVVLLQPAVPRWLPVASPASAWFPAIEPLWPAGGPGWNVATQGGLPVESSKQLPCATADAYIANGPIAAAGLVPL